jgi:hypothetical protein
MLSPDDRAQLVRLQHPRAPSPEHRREHPVDLRQSVDRRQLHAGGAKRRENAGLLRDLWSSPQKSPSTSSPSGMTEAQAKHSEGAGKQDVDLGDGVGLARGEARPCRKPLQQLAVSSASSTRRAREKAVPRKALGVRRDTGES